MSWHRIKAIMKRHAYVLRRSPPRWFDVLVWPVVDAVLFGALGVYVARQGGTVEDHQDRPVRLDRRPRHERKLRYEGAQASDHHVALAVSDTGPGIPRDMLPRVFEPFYSAKPNGSGLGLTIAERIVTAHGGRIDIDAAPGGGTRVTMRFPIEAA